MTSPTGYRCWTACFVLLNLVSVGLAADRDVLEAFYVKCDGDNWNNNTNWLDNQTSICLWTGVECNEGQPETVERIILPNNNVTCSLPPELFALQDLAWLDLRQNIGVTADFSVLDPSAAPSLVHLILSDTSVASVEGISAFAGSLNTLFMAGCALSGPFPEELTQLAALKDLDMSYNLLSAEIPDAISSWTDIRTWAMTHNLLSGQIPATIGSLTKLTNWQLQYNQLSGTLPAEINNLEAMTFFCLNDQVQGTGDERTGGITGPLVDMSRANSLFYVDFSNNRLTGTVPPTILASVTDVVLAQFINLDLRSNELEGDIPVELARFESIRLYLSNNRIGAIPPELCTKGDWLFGSVELFGCDAILCPPNSFNTYGRQPIEGSPCRPCMFGSQEFYGGLRCGNENTIRLDSLENFTVTGPHRERLYLPEPTASGSNDNGRLGLTPKARSHEIVASGGPKIAPSMLFFTGLMIAFLS